MKLDMKKLLKKLDFKDVSNSNITEIFKDAIHRYYSNSKLKPKKASHHVGIEVECFGDISEDALCLLILECDLEKYIQVSDDGSIESHCDNSYELRILIPEVDMKKVFPRLKVFFKKSGLETNDSCGLHVHLDMRNRNFDKCLTKLRNFEDALFGMVGSDRWTSDYCKHSSISHGGERFRAINTQAFEQHKTIEVRLHHGTTDADKIYKWVKLLVNIVSAKTVPEVSTKADVLKWKGLKKSLRPYVQRTFDPKFLSNKKKWLAIASGDYYDDEGYF